MIITGKPSSMRLYIILLLLSLAELCSNCFAAIPYYFRNYTVENGLSNNCVTSILQDKTGFLWIGTKDGLNRFNGYSFEVFRKNPLQSGAIGSNYIHALYEDKLGILWIGTENGMYRYNEQTETFSLVPNTFNMYVDDINEDKNGNIWLQSSSLLYRYKKQSNRLEFIDHRKLFSITNLCKDKNGTLWVSTTNGYLEKYDPQTHTFYSFNLFKHSKPVYNKWIESMYCTSDGYIVAGTSNREIKLFDPARSFYEDITFSDTLPTNLYIRNVLQTSNDELWLGTEFGIFVYNKKTKLTHHLTKQYNNPYSITDNAVYAMCKDREGGIWVGTFFGGINYLPKQYTPFTKYYPQQGTNAISGNVVREIQKDNNGNLWIGTEDGGVNKLNLQTGQFTNYKPGGKNDISFANIHGLHVSGNYLWIGTFLHGLDVMDMRTGKVVKHYSAQNGDGLTHDFIYTISTLKNETIVITTPHGALSFNSQTHKFEWLKGFPQMIWYTGIYQDKDGTIWAPSFGNGIHYYNPSTGASGNYKHVDTDTTSLNNNRVNAVYEDSQNQLWFTTDEGLCRLNKATGKFVRFGIKNGFPSNFMFSILEDDMHRLWISTTRGLVCFTPSNGNIEIYNTDNGLLNEQFNYNSAFKDVGGQMYFGSTEGLISFNPKEFKHSNIVFPVLFTGFFTNGNDNAARNNSLIKKIIPNTTDAITLPYNQSTFSVDFASLSFTSPGSLHYSYQMNGLSKNWLNVQSNRRADFVGLPPGTYHFNVKAMRSDGKESPISTLKIVILPPWWLNIYSQILYFVLAIIAVLLIIRFTNKRIKDKNRRQIELLKIANEKEMLERELAREKEMLEEKINFFTNVAHEIKTPLTLIKVPLTKVIKKTAGLPELENNLKIMNRNTDRLIELTKQLLDFRQTEIGKFKISLKRVNICQLVSEASQGFADLAESDGITFIQRIPDQPLYAWIDEDAFSKIIYNLLSNAVKYAATKVIITLLYNDETFTIHVENDGFIIPDSLKEKIFEAFYRIEETELKNGTGIGLALSRSLAQLQNGSLVLAPSNGRTNIFTLSMPVQNI